MARRGGPALESEVEVIGAVEHVLASSGGGEGLKVVVPLIAAALALIGVFVTLIVNGRRDDRERQRRLYAGGWAAVQAYKEMAFAIRRRDIANPGPERVRLSDAMREIQRDLSYHEALIGHERPGAVADAYRELVAKTREIAGGIIKRTWDEAPIASDEEMHSPQIASELRALKPAEDAYMDAAAAAVR